ncbi:MULTISPECIES: RNase A-like domain-containing protein [unclassified Streptomyces]|uniref:RNase A-like domain-containing protein n=1 Tax=unclassified Streptomyces TaxID=2593676 RepID=UPI00068B554A|nr:MULTISPECIES: RNase A-like domain-containing protein [unclassified Streptomyces]
MARLLSRDRTRSRTRKQPPLVKRISLLVAGTLTAGLISTVPAAAADTPAVPAAPIALASVAATGDDQLFALAADRSAVYRWSGHGTEWAKIGGPAQDLYAGGAGLFATSLGSGQLSKYNGQPDSWSPVGGAGADFAVTGDHVYGLNPERTAVYEWNGTGTDWTKIGGPAQGLEAGGAGLFATSPDGKLHKYNGQPDTWSEIGGAGADFAVTGDHLYGLNPERTAVYEWNGTGTDWTKVGGPALDLHAGGAGLFATSPDRKIHRYSGQPEQWGQVGEAGKAFTVGGSHLYGLAPDGNSVHRWSGQGTDWTVLGAPSSPVSPPAPPQPTEQAPPPVAPDPADENAAADEHGPEAEDPEPAEGGDAALAMAVTAKDDLYTLTPDHSALWRRSGSRWEQISGPAGSVYAGRAGVFITRPDTNKQISKYNDETRAWEPIGEANGSFAITGDHLYHLTPDGIGQWDGDDWTGIGGPAKNIYAGGAGLFATNRDTGHIYQYGGKPNHWTEIGGPGATFASGHDRLYAITPDHSAVYEWSGNGTEWTRIGGPAENIYAGGAGLFATDPDTGHIYQYNGTPDRWTEIGGPGATFTVSDTQLYGLTPDRSATYRWDGKAGWTRIGGPENAAQREEDERLLRENCQPAGRDCVKELRDAEKILETSLTDWLKDNSLEFLLDTFDINDIRKCAADTDLNRCLTVLLDAGSVILGVGALKKAKNTLNAAEGLHKFADKAKRARDTYNDLRKIIDTARKATKNLPDQPDQAADIFACNSFPAGTPVLMANGSHRPIEDVRAGDLVLATEPGGNTELTQPRPVRSVPFTSAYTDKAFVRVTVPGDGGVTASVTSTENHRYWLPERQTWVPAGELRVGDRLRTSEGEQVTVSATIRYADRRDTYDLDVTGIDSYYVQVGTDDVLVHNCTDLARAEREFKGIAHTLDEHVNVTLQKMKDLAVDKTLRTGRPTRNSRWSSADLAQKAVNQLVEENKARVAKWVEDSGKPDGKRQLTLPGTYGTGSLGDSMDHLGNYRPTTSNRFTVTLVAEKGHKPGGFYVLTAYPL